MVASWPILQTKLALPPVQADSLLARPRLLARLNEVWQHRLAVLVAPAGYGKTSLLGQWAGQQPAGRTAWYTLEESDANRPGFLAYLGAALQSVIPQAVANAHELLADERANLDNVLAVLLQGLVGLPGPFALILDDAQYIANCPSVLAVIEQVLRHASPSFHLVIAARQEPVVPAISRLRVMGRVIELTETDLRFTPAEVAQLFQAVLGLPLPPEMAAQLAERTEGWAVALQLAYQAGVRYGRTEAEQLLRHFDGTPRQLYDYLAHVVLEGQSSEARVFLRRTAILNQLDPATCNALLDRQDAAAMLAQLEQCGLFTFPLDLGHTAYRYHALFRDFLQRRLIEIEGAGAVRLLHQRAAACLLAQGRDEPAMNHLLAAADYEAAADLVRALRTRLFRASRQHILETWLTQFPPAFLQSHAWLILTRARVTMMRGEWSQSEQFYRQAEAILVAQQDREGLCTVYHDLAELARSWRGDFAGAERLYRQWLAIEPSPEGRAIGLGWVANCLYLAGGDPQEALALLDEALGLSPSSPDPLVRAGLLNLQALLLSRLGDMLGATTAFDTALDLMEATGNRHQQVGLLNNAAYLHLLLGDLDQAEPLIQRSLELARAFERRGHLAYALNMMGQLCQRRHEFERALQFHTEALALQRQMDMRYEIPVTLNFMGLLARHAGRLDEARRLGREGLALREGLGNEYETGLSLIDLGATELARGDRTLAGELWQRAWDLLTPCQARYEQAQLAFYLAVLAQQQGDEPALAAHLAQAEALACAYRHANPPRCLHVFIEEAAWTAPLLAEALRQDRPSACVDCLLPRLGPAAGATLVPLLADARPAVRAHAARLLGQLNDVTALEPLVGCRRDRDSAVRQAAEAAIAAILATPPAPLRVQCLGGFRVWRGEHEITHWERSASRTVFQYLLERQPAAVPMDVLIDMLWPDGEPVKARKNLHQAVASMRRVLEPELAAGLPSRYVQVGEGTYALALPAGSHVDWSEFEAQVRCLLAQDRSDLAALTEALALYQGDYLPEAMYQDWTALQRERLRELYLAGLIRLSRGYLAAGQYQQAVHSARQILTRDAWNEDATLLLMQAHERLHDIPAARRAYEATRDRLQADLGLPSRADLVALYERLCHR